jgi:NADH-quinone oxidoreductase subunit B
VGLTRGRARLTTMARDRWEATDERLLGRWAVSTPITIGARPTDGGRPEAPAPLRFSIGGGDGTDAAAGALMLSVFNVGLACCAVEFDAAAMRHQGFADVAPGSAPTERRPGDVNVMVVSGTVTDKMAPAIKRLYDAMPAPKHVISFGSCANCGGPYWDSYCVTKGIDQLIPVDVYVPGCPPRPEALLHGVELLRQTLGARSGVAP